MSEISHASELTRRRMLQGSAVALTVATGAFAIGLVGPAGDSATAADPGASDSFDEIFHGRRIQGRPITDGGAGHHHTSGTTGAGGNGYAVHIDGEELHMMRNADGTWISVVNHYQTHPTPRALARAAVNDLQGAALVPVTVA
ncbi:tyrosinase cofactor [Kitasatospora sp. NPDC096147]|uniref:apotyrosinase chaperone MelC1 n=1 Tax=Kitasatospora sp. NPDC096147 TaxID=3364093 RepID=UPI00382581E4